MQKELEKELVKIHLLSIDIDVLDPAHAPGTGTPEIAGMTTREILNVLRGLFIKLNIC